MNLNVKIKYCDGVEELKAIKQGDLIDISVAEDVAMKQGEYKLLSLGVAMMMILLKVARDVSGESKRDNLIDIAGYAACAEECEK